MKKSFEFEPPGTNVQYLDSIRKPKEEFFYTLDRDGNVLYGSDKGLKLYNSRGLHSFANPQESFPDMLEGFSDEFIEKIKSRPPGYLNPNWKGFQKAYKLYQQEQERSSKSKTQSSNDDSVDNSNSPQFDIISSSKVLAHLLILYYLINIPEVYYYTKSTIMITKKQNTLFMALEKIANQNYEMTLPDYQRMYFLRKFISIAVLPLSTSVITDDDRSEFFTGKPSKWQKQCQKIIDKNDEIEKKLKDLSLSSSNDNSDNGDDSQKKNKKNKSTESQPSLSREQSNVYTNFLSPILSPQANCVDDPSEEYYSSSISQIGNIKILSYSSIDALAPKTPDDIKPAAAATKIANKDSSLTSIDHTDVPSNYLSIRFAMEGFNRKKKASFAIKLLKIWAKAWISGTSHVSIVRMSREGKVAKIEEMDRKDMYFSASKLLNQTVLWNPDVCLEKYAEILEWIKTETKDGEDGSVWELVSNSEEKTIHLEKIEESIV